ncbi:MAG: pyruvate dehydrogenase complex E1 component subunit beta [Rhodothermaeota bacterium MED-G12]|jgi:pyruvate dehydrogenase E1 component beta subunit|nr:pyruvate dehydrogenase complex E1 component subunit beta [Balneolaceae bacterium]MDA0736459.1 pyruvate dehydrogenase complex E1 component subunit beta [Bacteroidota bacterium]PDH57030.1 MAG: pyruvate dehydrogenase complex E1 component subunit beta [Rhodothermaeota bacterium MED-G12]MBL6916446.1 pyruvate dehydrogenase complex E1 component subunit beta [Balneolaceae bacterium]MDA1125827.1 pyruvate dehydrogenase complex E1 component subunit beta [Bacteroidota bacterium]|tara:strand:- start:4282 stop:5259 length:978 start_codon:yes stop_codon:yes gene_type:complete
MAVLQFREALKHAIDEEMARDERVFVMGEEVAEYNGAYKVTEGLLDKYGYRRVIDTPISELGFAGLGVGAAMNGLKPIVEFMTFNFAVLAADQIINHATKVKYMTGGQADCPIVFRGPNASAGQLGATHSVAYDSMYAQFPGLKVIYVSEPNDAKGLMKSAIRDENPVLFMESEQMYGLKGEVSDEEDFIIPIGKGKIKREGSDVTLVAHGKMYHLAVQAANELAKDGIECEIIDPRTVKPLDLELILQSVKKTNRCIVIDEAHPFAGFAAEIGFLIQREAFDYLDAPVLRVCLPDVNAPFSKPLFDAWLPSPKQIIDAVKQVSY